MKFRPLIAAMILMLSSCQGTPVAAAGNNFSSSFYLGQHHG